MFKSNDGPRNPLLGGRLARCLVLGLSCVLSGAMTAFPVSGIASEIGTTTILKSLFPRAYVERASPDERASSAILEGVVLRGKRGFVPIGEVSRLRLSESISVMAFPIYWTEPERPGVSAPPRDAGFPTPKLTQVIFFDSSDGRFIAKPPGFPLETSGWSDAISVIGFERITNAPKAAVFRYAYGTGPGRLQVMAFADGRVYASDVLRFGDLGGESGVGASARYAGWVRSGRTISAEVTTTCEADQPDYCRAIGLVPGDSSTRTVLLELPEP